MSIEQFFYRGQGITLPVSATQYHTFSRNSRNDSFSLDYFRKISYNKSRNALLFVVEVFLFQMVKKGQGNYPVIHFAFVVIWGCYCEHTA